MTASLLFLLLMHGVVGLSVGWSDYTSTEKR